MEKVQKVWPNRILAVAIITVIDFVAFALSLTACNNKTNGPTHTHIPGAEATCTTAQICTDCGDIMHAALGHNHESSLICKREGCDHQYAIGEIGPGGGKIFRVVSAGFTVEASPGGTPAGRAWAAYTAYYLEAAPANEATTPQWGAYSTEIPGVATYPDAADTTLIGNGRKDTRIIVNYLNTIPETGRAAQLCDDKTVTYNGIVYNDWFLPSSGELRYLYDQRSSIGISLSGTAADWYWSSSQRSQYHAWGLSFASGTSSFNAKDDSTRGVRAIRAF